MAAVKIAELSGPALDWAVAMADGIEGAIVHHGWVKIPIPNIIERVPERGIGYKQFRPSASWRVMGLLIDIENLMLSPPTSPVHRTGGPNAGNGSSGVWMASTWHKGVNGRRAVAWHERSPTIAAARCYAILKLGDEVDVPDELLVAAP